MRSRRRTSSARPPSGRRTPRRAPARAAAADAIPRAPRSPSARRAAGRRRRRRAPRRAATWEGSERLSRSAVAGPALAARAARTSSPGAWAEAGEPTRPSSDDAARRVDGDDLAVAKALRRVLRADDARDPELAGDDRCVAGHAAGIGDDRGRPPHQRHPVRRGHARHEHVAVAEPSPRRRASRARDRAARGRRARRRARAAGSSPAASVGASLVCPTAVTGRDCSIQSFRPGRSPTRCPAASRSAARSSMPSPQRPCLVVAQRRLRRLLGVDLADDGPARVPRLDRRASWRGSRALGSPGSPCRRRSGRATPGR